MSAVAAVAEKPSAPAVDRVGVIAILQDQPTLERIQAIVRELHLDDELSLEPTLDAALRRMREGESPRVLILDLSDSAAPIAELSAARTVGGEDIKIVALGVVNDVALFRDLLAAGATDYVVKPVSREALAAALEKRSAATAGTGGLGQVIAFIGSRGGVGTTMTAVSCAWTLAEKHNQPTALLDLDLHFGTVALKLDTDPGSGLSDALEQPSRIDSLFVERATVAKAEFEKAVGKPLDAVLPYDAKSAGAATNAGQPLPLAAPRSPVAREVDKLVAAITASPAQKSKKRKIFGIW